MTEVKVERKPLKTGRDMAQFMENYYYELDRASKSRDRKIAWCTSVGPAELLRAMGFLLYFPETHSAMLGSTRMATDYIPHANAIGYSPEVCSYMTADIGAYLNHITPLTKTYKGIESIPRPDVLVYNTNQCRDVKDWFTWYAKQFNVPVIGIKGNTGVEEVTEPIINGVAEQIKGLVEPLEKVIGKKLDMAKFEETVGLSRKCSDLWQDVLQSASATPSPLTFFDGTTLMGPAVVGRGTQAAIDIYVKLLAEINERVANKMAAVDGERHRIYWEGMPVWGRLSAHSKLFAGLKTNVLASTYCSSWIFKDLEASDPFKSMARAYTNLFIVRGDGYKEQYIKDKIKLYKTDGIIFHDSKTCRTNTNCRYGMHKRLEKELGIPTLTINGDLNDLRCISDEQTTTNIEAFIEQLDEKSKK